MKKILTRGGIEFLAVLLGITGSLFIEDKKYYDFISLLDKRENVEFLISKIEDLHFNINK